MMLPRVFLFLLLAGLGAAQASDKIDAPAEGASAKVKQPHVIAELIPEMTTIEAGKPFGMILHLHMDPDWHTYWINPGDAGIPTLIKWTLPPGFSAGPIEWPVPEKHAMGPLITYGYDGDVYLLTTITPPASGDLPQHLDIKAKAAWLVCREECIPGKAELTVTLDSGLMNFRLPTENTELFKEARARLPVENTRWKVTASYQVPEGIMTRTPALLLEINFVNAPAITSSKIGNVYFFPEQGNVLAPDWTKAEIPRPDEEPAAFVLRLPLEQNGETPDKLSGVLVSDQPLIGDAKAVYIAEFPVTGGTGAGPAAATNTTTANSQSTAGAASAGTAAATADNSSDGHRPPLQTEAQPLLIAVLGAAFIGGLILNLMPCVLPVLSLKVFSLIKHAGDHPGRAWQQGAAFTAGVVISFWLLAGALLALRAAGNHLGWGFQMQSPGFVAALMILFFLIALNLFGVFEIGTSLVGLDAKAASRTGGLTSSFFNGALATLAATPCTAPFMGSALGFAAQQPAIVSLLIFTALALGMAAPYLLLTIFPQTLRFVPKPGAWMESLKQFMGFLLMGTVIYYIYCFVALIGPDQLVWVLAALLVAGIAAWIYGRWSAPTRSSVTCVVATALSMAFLLGAMGWMAALAATPATQTAATTSDNWQNWSPTAVQSSLAKGQPVFVDFTAAWCLSCKVNERVALGTDAVKKAFADKNVALFRADWTHSDPAISQTLQQYKRDGVPLYLLYSPKLPDAPQVLPEVLTPGIVLDALNKI